MAIVGFLQNLDRDAEVQVCVMWCILTRIAELSPAYKSVFLTAWYALIR